ncbi:hypothetical protein Tco_1398906 [Tanacetum coccineum]
MGIPFLFLTTKSIRRIHSRGYGVLSPFYPNGLPQYNISIHVDTAYKASPYTAEHFWLLTVERLQGLSVIMRDLPVIDMTELVRLQICEELDDTWAWVALGPERQPDVAADAPEIAEGAPNVVEGDQAVPTPVQEPQPPPAARTISQRLARLEEDVHGIHVSLGEQHEMVDTIAKDFSRFTVWAAGGISQILDSAGATYVRYSETHVPYERRRVRQRTGKASTSAAPLDEDRPDP